MHKLKCPLPLKVTFVLKQNQIASISLSKHQEKELQWEFVTDSNHSHLISLLNDWMKEYAKGKQPSIYIALSFVDMPAYTKQVLKELQKIPFGTRVQYKDLAKKTGNPLAARAVGNACARNPFPLLIPCHRVVASNGLGGFSGGLGVKELLLEFESCE